MTTSIPAPGAEEQTGTTHRQEDAMPEQTGDEQTTDERTADAARQDAGRDERQDQDDEQTGGKANREAARYRTQLRQVEAERDRLAGQVEALQRQAIERLVVETHRGKPAGLWASGVTVADLVNEDGTVNPDKVKQAWDKAAAELGLRVKPAGLYVPGLGNIPDMSGTRPSWSDALRGRAGT